MEKGARLVNMKPLILLAALALAGCAETPLRQGAIADRADLAQVTLEPESARGMINAYRASKGLAPLTFDDKLNLAARRHASDLARRDRISHRGADGSDPWARVKETGYRPRLAAENVGAGQMSFAEVLQGWKDSPGHNRNLLLPDATHLGLALVKAPATRFGAFWALVLGTPKQVTAGSARPSR